MSREPAPRLSWVGIDVSKSTFDAALWGHQPLPRMSAAAFPRTSDGADAFLFWAQLQAPGSFGVVMEATGRYSTDLAGWIQNRQPDLRVAIVNPYRAKSFARSLGLRDKTDVLDARMLARFGEERQPPAWVPLDPGRAALRDICRTRHWLVRMQATVRTRSGDGEGWTGAPRSVQERILNALTGQIEVLDLAVDDLAATDPELAESLRLLESIPGVGRVTAATMLAEAGDLRAYRQGRHLASFLGLAPRLHESGTSVHRPTRMSRMGGPHARVALFMAALAASRTSSPLGDFYRDLVARGKPKRSALGALMRKIALVMRSVLIQGSPYQDVSPTEGRRSHTTAGTQI